MGWADADATAQTQQHQLLGANEQLENLFYDIEQLPPEQQKNFLKMMRAALLLFLEQEDNGNN